MPRRWLVVPAIAILGSGCGDGAAKKPVGFPRAAGRGLEQVLAEGDAGDVVLAPSVMVLRPGPDRYGFGLFTVKREAVTDVDATALYVQPEGGGRATGPYRATLEDLVPAAGFRSKTTSEDPDSAKSVWVAHVRFPRGGAYRVGGLVSRGGKLERLDPTGALVKSFDRIPKPGDRAPRVSTPTVKSVGGRIKEIETRDPPDTMHRVNLADALGRRPVVLIFATPALCQSRTCGPVVDIAEQVKATYGDRAAFIHVEVYRDNDPNKGLRTQLAAFGLESEPWTFVIDRRGIVRYAVEGALGAKELAGDAASVIRR